MRKGKKCQFGGKEFANQQFLHPNPYRMKPIFFFSIIALLFFGSCSQKSKPKIDESLLIPPNILCGTVQFSDGCGTEIDSLIQFGLALIHHMTYDDAEEIFDRVIQVDEDCFWGHWGKAMTYIHPLWPDVPSEERMRMGWVLSQRALALAQKEKEKHYGVALAAYYENGQNKTEKERLTAYATAWKEAYDQMPKDLEAQAFHVLSRLSNVSPNDKTYSVQLEAGALAEKILEEIPDHPGGFHYAIHAYDYPPIAHKAVRVARNYSSIAPEIPHALHMPTHIFTRLGHWEESIEWNTRSAQAAWKMPANGQVSLHYLHALDYLVYARLQQAEDQLAIDIMKSLDTLPSNLQVHAAAAYSLAAIPGRIAIENKNWAEAASIEVPIPDQFPWKKFPQFEAIVHFAKGVGGARNGQTDISEQAIYRLQQLIDAMGTKPSTKYWRNQIEIQKTAVQAWHAYASKKPNEALKMMEKAAQLEDATEKSPITPGEVVPIREMYGDLYMELNQPGKALEQYELSLVRNPNRFNTVFGAGKAAKLAGQKEKAKALFMTLMELKGEQASDRGQIAYAEGELGG